MNNKTEILKNFFFSIASPQNSLVILTGYPYYLCHLQKSYDSIVWKNRRKFKSLITFVLILEQNSNRPIRFERQVYS